MTPVWVGLHNGSFDLCDAGERAPNGVEVLAETGNAQLLSEELAAPGRLQGVIGNGPIGLAAVVTDSIAIQNPLAYHYMSFASMVIPSNDGFFGNDNPFAYEVFDAIVVLLAPSPSVSRNRISMSLSLISVDVGDPVAVPEPSTFVVWACFGIGAYRRKFKREVRTWKLLRPRRSKYTTSNSSPGTASESDFPSLTSLTSVWLHYEKQFSIIAFVAITF